MNNKILWMSLDDAGQFISRRKPYVNHAIGLLRTVLHNADINTDLKDLRYVWTKKQVRDRVRGYDTLLMSIMTFNFKYAVTVARIFKECNPNGRVIVGGVHASVDLAQMINTKEFDTVIQGPGENVIVDMINNLCEGQTYVTKHLNNSLNSWPTINRSLCSSPLEDYSPLVKPPTITMLTSKKCKYSCSFCNEGKLFDNEERMSPRKVIEDLNKTYREFKFKSVIFHDSNFLTDPQWLRRFIVYYIHYARKRWPCWAAGRTDFVCKNPNLIKGMVDFTNFETISLGLESGSDNVLKILRKGCTADQNHEAIGICNKLDLRIYANIMLGIPGETKADAMKTVDMVNSINNPIVAVSFYSPYAGTTLGDKIIAEGRSLVNEGDYHRYAGKALVKGIDYKWYDKNILPKIKNYRPAKLSEKVGRWFCSKLAKRILK